MFEKFFDIRCQISCLKQKKPKIGLEIANYEALAMFWREMALDGQAL